MAFISGWRISLQLPKSQIIKSSLIRNLYTKPIQPVITPTYNVIDDNLKKPEVDLSKHDPEGLFSPSVVDFIRARDYENSGGRKIDVISLYDGAKKGTIEINDYVFGTNPRIDILHRNAVWYRACIRVGSGRALDRSEKRGGGKKPWPQKGQGKARHGSIRSPLWHKGGIAKRSAKPKDWSYTLPYPIIRMGLRVALSCRYAQGDLVVVEDLSSLPEESEGLYDLLYEQGLSNCHIVDAYENEELNLLTTDMNTVSSTHALFLHVYGILRQHKLVLSLDALRILEEKLAEDNRIINAPNYHLYHEDMLFDKNLFNKEYDPKREIIRGEKEIPPSKLKPFNRLTKRSLKARYG